MKRPGSIRRNLTITALLITLIGCGYYIRLSLTQNHGHFVYPLDDTYIFTSLAKHVAMNGVWGITPFEFSSTTSSPLYTLLLSMVYFMTGPLETAPLVINLIAGIVLLWVMHRQSVSDEGWKSYAFLLCMVVVFIPLPVLIISGMEHTLHLIAMVILLRSFHESLTNPADRKSWKTALIAASIAPALRYETLFLAPVFFGLLWLVKRRSDAFVMLASLASLVLLYGLFSIWNGSYILPNTLLVKGRIPEFSVDGAYIFVKGVAFILMKAPEFYAMLALGVITLIMGRGSRSGLQSWLTAHNGSILLVWALIMHLCFARESWLIGRYEAYLLLMTGMVGGEMLEQFLRERSVGRLVMISLASLLFAWPMVRRLHGITHVMDKAMQNIHDQQIQMAEFLRAYYPHAFVAANDIGAMTYFNDIRLFDMVGLGSVEVIRERHTDRQDFYRTFARAKGVDIAIVYESWFMSKIPPEWEKAGTWTIADNRVCGHATVTFYAVDTTQTTNLKQHLEAYAPRLENGVVTEVFH